MTRIVILSAIYMAVAAGIMFLQAHLSKSQKKWPGFILPILFFIISLLAPLNMAVPETGITGGFVLRLLFSWLMGNIPTFVMLGIYFVSRQEQKKESKH